MDLKNLKTFLYAAELSSFTRAAERLGFSQPTVTFQIKQLERELDTHLFERVRHTVKLTEEGRAVLRYAYQIALPWRSRSATGWTARSGISGAGIPASG